VSTTFAPPSWQSTAGVPPPPAATGGRGVPDVAGDADPETGYQVRVDGQDMVIGGTSAVAPLWAGLIALANKQNGGSAGFINPAIYSAAGVNAFRDITQGNNGSFSAGPGWDACTGQGSPVGAGVIAVVAPVTAAAPAVAGAGGR
jgi:kumamolisin